MVEPSDMDDMEETGNPSSDSGSSKQLPVSAGQLAQADLLQAYLAEVRRHALLSPEEERDLAERYAADGDPLAAQRLVSANLRLVVKLAFQYHRQWSNVLDLIQEGNVGLMEALKRYDPYRGIRFSSYAQYWIRAMILRFLMDNFRIVRLGTTRHGRKLFFQLNKERERLTEAGYNPSTLELAKSLDVPESEVVLMDQHMRSPAVSIHSPVGEDEGRLLEEVVAPESQLATDDEAAENELGLLIQRLLRFRQSLADDRERAIWDLRLTSSDPLSLSQLGEKFGVSKERVRQLESRMRARLKQCESLGDEIDFSFRIPEDEDAPLRALGGSTLSWRNPNKGQPVQA